MELVKIIHPADSPRANFHYVHQDQVIDLAPGESRIVDFDVAVAAFGHPNEIDTPNNRSRTDNYNRIRFQWGYQMGIIGADEDWEAKRPWFRVETLDGEWVPMLLEDPAGVLPKPSFIGGTGQSPIPQDPNVAILQSTIAQQAAEMDQLKSMLASILANQQAAAGIAPTNAVADSNASELPAVADVAVVTDSPATVPVDAAVVEDAPASAPVPAPTSSKSK